MKYTYVRRKNYYFMCVRMNEISFEQDIFNQNGTNINASLIAFLICNAHLPNSLENKTINIRAVNIICAIKTM